MLIGSNNRPQNKDYEDANGNFHPQGNDDLKIWAALKTNVIGGIVAEYADKFVPEALMRGVAHKIYSKTPGWIPNGFAQDFSEQMRIEYGRHKKELEAAKVLENKLREKSLTADKEEAASTPGNPEAAPKAKVIKLEGGLMFSESEFESVADGKLKLKGRKRSITLTKKQMEQLSAVI